MASAYPGAVDALVRPDGTDPLSDGHAALHNATSDAVEAVQTELGTTPSGSAATVAARFTAAESATADAQADATTALADAATADGKAVTAQATADAAVSKATYDAHSVLAATIDDTPAAVTVAEQTLLGRKTGGNIAALTVAEGKTLLGLGTAAVVDVPASGDATSGQAVKGSDSRLSDARTPTAHKASHESGGSDAVTLAPAQITGTAVVTADARLSDARTPTAHKTSHQSGGSDEVTLAQSQVTDLTSDLGLKAPLASPTLTGVPTAPTAAVDTNTTQVATTAFTVAQINAGRADDAVAKSAVGNLLTANQASIESDTTGWNTPLNGTYAANTTLARNATIAADGSASVQATAVGAGIFGLASSTLSGQLPVQVHDSVGHDYTFSMQCAYSDRGRPTGCPTGHVLGRQSLATVYSTPTVPVAPLLTWQRLITDVGSQAIPSTSSWGRRIFTVVVPDTAASVWMYVIGGAATTSSVHYLDCFSLDLGGCWRPVGATRHPHHQPRLLHG